MNPARRLATALALGCVVAAPIAGCGSTGGTDAVAPAPANPDKPATGTLRVFTYEDTTAPDLMAPFEKQNPGLTVQTASFGSDEEAAAKLAGGFQADVVESCLDEMQPLTEQGLLRPLDPAGVPEWGNLAFTEAPGVTENGKTWVVPLSAGPQGLIVNAEKVKDVPHSWKALFDPAYAGEVSLEGDYELPAIAEAALAMGIKEPMRLSKAQLEEVSAFLDEHRSQFRSLWEADSDLVNLFKSGEIVLSDGGPGVAARMVEAGIPVEWIAPEEGPLSWVCGLSITANSQNVEAAYRLINWQASPRAQAIRADNGYVVTNPKAMPLVAPADKATADPATIAGAIPESRRPNEREWVHVFQEFQAQ
ncbi:MAG: extracellular solute-binding protein [Actinobacteria bacterium]|nr:extracellular solute-binding protein [Actinomycetota bacterium]